MRFKYAKVPCGRCGWKYETFHICLDLPPEVMQRVEDGSPPPKKRPRNRTRDARSDAIRGSDEWKANLSAAWEQRRERDRIRNQPRDAEIIRRYVEEEHTVKELRIAFGVSNTTILGVLHRAQDAGDLVMRSPVANRWG